MADEIHSCFRYNGMVLGHDVTRIGSLVIGEGEIIEAKRICAEVFPLIKVKPFQFCRIGVVTNGSEVSYGHHGWLSGVCAGTPEDITVSIVAEMIQHRAARKA